jgi:galactose oxidase
MFRSFTAALFFCGMSVLNLASAATTTQIVNAGNRLCVGVAKASTDAAAPVSQIACDGSASTSWALDPQGNGYYHLVSQVSGMCLNVNGGNGTTGTTLVQYPCQQGVGNDQWALVAVGSNYHLVSFGSGLCVNVPGASGVSGTQLIQWTCQGATALNDQFTLTAPATPSAFTIMVANSGLCIGVPGGSTTAGANITQAACTGSTDRTWKVQTLANGYKQLVLQSSGMCLNVYGGNGGNGTQLIQWPCQTNANNDQWSLVSYGTGYHLVSRGSGLCANVFGESKDAGAKIVQWPCGGGNAFNDQFKMMPSVTPPATLPSAWSAVIPLAVNPVGAANLPNDKILIWAANSLFTFQSDVGYTNTQTYFSVFNPADNSSTQQLETSAGSDMFCPGTAMLSDGRLLVNGGDSSPKTSLYDWRTNTWAAAATMNIPRGYQGTTPLSNGNVFTLGGSWSGGLGGKAGEVWDPNNGWTRLSGVPSTNVIGPDPQGVYRGDNHLWLFAQSNGTVFHAGPSSQMNWISTTGNGSIQSAGTRGIDAFSINGNAVMYDIGKILKVGGAVAYGQNFTQPTYASDSVYKIDISKGFGQQPVVTQQASMSYRRSMSNAVVLPTGQVVVIGGQAIPQPFTDTAAILTPEIWNPATGNWNLLKPMQTPRTYHSTALLMADGRVFVGGGGLCGNGCAQNHANAEILSPPYLFNSDGSVAARPTITSAPSTGVRGSNISVSTGAPVGSFALVRLGSVTHTVNNDQRRVPLAVTGSSGNTYSLAIPADAGVVPPGHYMLFAMSTQLVPSVSVTIQIQ